MLLRRQRRAARFQAFAFCAACIFCYLLYSWVGAQFRRQVSKRESRYAYATFLSPRAGVDTRTLRVNDTSVLDADPYFTSIRLLAYQLLHAPNTRSRDSFTPIPFLVLALPSVPAAQIEVLKADGATIVPIAPLDLPAGFGRPELNRTRFRDVLSKLRVWQLTQYDRILCLDADTVVLKPLDSIFDDPELSTPMLPTTAGGGAVARVASTDPPPLPSSYVLAASADTWGRQDDWIVSNHPVYLCACFMLLQPSAELFAHYQSLLSRPEAPFEATYPDQDLLIYAHRSDGPLPWRRIPVEWSANDGNFVGRTRSVHVKAWAGAEGANIEGKERVQEIRDRLLLEMEALGGARRRS